MNVSETQKIWICWFQGEDNAPNIIKTCINSIRKHANGREVVVITMDNFHEFVDFPNYILEKLNRGNISLTHFSDILRSALLYKHGGVWIDSTFILTRNIGNEWFDNIFYSIKKTDEDLNVSGSLWCGYFMAGKKGNILHEFLYSGLIEYWKNTDVQVDYLLVDYIIRTGYERNPLIKNLIDVVPNNNEYVEFFLKYDTDLLEENKYNEIMNNTHFFKLTYKKKLGTVDQSYGKRFMSDYVLVAL